MSFTPDPEPTPAQLVDVSDILGVDGNAAALSIISDFDSQEETDARWGKTLSDLTNYALLTANADNVKKVGEIEFFEGKADDALLALTNTIRRRYRVAETATLEPELNLVTTLSYF